MSKQQKDFNLTNGEETYWTNSAFGGMPTYQLGAKYAHNYIKKIDSFIRFLPRPADYLFIYLVSFYILLLTLKIDFDFSRPSMQTFYFFRFLLRVFGTRTGTPFWAQGPGDPSRGPFQVHQYTADMM